MTSGHPRVLLVDDNIDMCGVLAEILHHIDFTVTVFHDPLLALAAFRAAPRSWDVVFSDQIMPNMLGTDLIGEIRAIRPGMPCLLCSGHVENLTETKAAEAGVIVVLRKPIELPLLLAALDRALAAGRSSVVPSCL